MTILWPIHVSFQMIDNAKHFCGDCQEANLGMCISVNCEDPTGFFCETIEVLSPRTCATEAAQIAVLVV